MLNILCPHLQGEVKQLDLTAARRAQLLDLDNKKHYRVYLCDRHFDQNGKLQMVSSGKKAILTLASVRGRRRTDPDLERKVRHRVEQAEALEKQRQEEAARLAEEQEKERQRQENLRLEQERSAFFDSPAGRQVKDELAALYRELAVMRETVDARNRHIVHLKNLLDAMKGDAGTCRPARSGHLCVSAVVVALDGCWNLSGICRLSDIVVPGAVLPDSAPPGLR